MAQDDTDEMSEAPEYTTEAGQFVYSWLRYWMGLTGMSEEEAAAEFNAFDEWYGGLNELQLDDLAEAHVASTGINALQTEMGDGDFLDLDDDEDDDMDDDDGE